MRKRNTVTLIFAVISFLYQIAFAQMQSDNYHITTSVMSSGGRTAGSTYYKTNSTISQPSPLMDEYLNPFSDNYDNYPGFWYTLEVNFLNTCDGDFEPDGDVDGTDLAELIADTNLLDLSTFAANFGNTNCPSP